LTSRPLIIPGSSTISLRLDQEIAGPTEEVYLTVDGQEGLKLNGGDRVEVQTSPYFVQTVASPYRSYFQTLSGKLKWATHELHRN
jgi:NAD+ kinase